MTFAEELANQHEYVAKEPLSAGAFAAWSDCSEPFTYLATLRQYHEIFTWKTRTTLTFPVDGMPPPLVCSSWDL